MILHRIAGCALALALLVTTACSKVSDGSDATRGRHPWTIPDVVRIGYSDEPDSLNELFSHTAATDEVANMLFAPIFRLDPKGELVPEMATVVPTYQNGGISKDNKTITLHLRHGMQWADGAPLDGRDVRFTWRAAMNPKNNTKLRIYWQNIAAMDLPDNDTVVIHLSEVNSGIIYGLFAGAGGAAYPPLPEHLLGKLPDLNHAAFNAMPLSSGPFVLKAWNHGSTLELVANEKYWRGPPKLKRITWKVVPNADTLLAQLRTHEIDVYDGINEIQIPELANLEGIASGKRLIGNWRHLMFNVRKPGLDDQRVRLAIAESVDWKHINDTIYHGYNQLASSDIMPTSWAAPTIPRYRFDPVDARGLLDAAGWTMGANGVRAKNGVPLHFTISTGTNRQANIMSEVQMQQLIKAVGIDLTIKNYPVSFLFAQQGPLYSGAFDMSWTIDTNGAEPDNEGSWSGKMIPPHGTNTSFLNDPELTRLAHAATLTFDRAKRKSLYQQEEERIHALVPAVFLYWENAYTGYNSDLKGLRLASYLSTLCWNSYEWSI